MKRKKTSTRRPSPRRKSPTKTPNAAPTQPTPPAQVVAEAVLTTSATPPSPSLADLPKEESPIPLPERSWARELGWIASNTPLPDLGDDASIALHFLACRDVGVKLARSKGAWDPEAIFVDAYRSVLLGKSASARAWAYLPLRVISRVWSSLRNRHALKTGSMAVHLSTLPGEALFLGDDPPPREWSTDECLAFLQVLDEPNRELIRQHYFMGWTLEELVAMGLRRRTPTALKAQLHRLRAKLRAYHGSTEGWL
jgi:DNA-directed RNA polymerase specialized sigma24 family protein